MTNTITISRKLLQRWIDNTDFFDDLMGKSMSEIDEARKEDDKIIEELRALLAAPVVAQPKGSNKCICEWDKRQFCGCFRAGVCDIPAAPVVERQEPVTETVPKHKFDTLVQHCKRLDADIAQARAHVNEITLYQQNAVWFWQHDGEDYLQSLSCPIIIQPHHLRELLEGKAQHNPIAEQPAPVAVVLLSEAREWLGDGKYSDGLARELWTPAYTALIDKIDGHLDKVKELNQSRFIAVDQGKPGGDMTATATFTREGGKLTFQSIEHSEPPCSFCFQRGCNGECHGDDMMGDS